MLSQIGRCLLGKVTPLDVQSIYTAMREQGLSTRTIRYTHCILKSAAACHGKNLNVGIVNVLMRALKANETKESILHLEKTR
jgi:hypothetical protein